MTNTDTIRIHGHDIDLRHLYSAMWEQSQTDQGEQVYNGLKSDTTAMKWLLNELFGIPVTGNYNKVYGDARRAVTMELYDRGWATKVNKHNEAALTGTAARTPRYVLHHEPELLP